MNIGMIGYKFMGKAHTHAYHDVKLFFPETLAPRRLIICGRDERGVSRAATQLGWEQWSTDWNEVVTHPAIDLVDINTPSNAHKEIALAALKNGKHVICEKPLAITLEDAREMAEAAEQSGAKHMVCFNYRFVPAIRLAKKLLDEGRIGQVRQYRGWFLQDWLTDKDAPYVWRLDRSVAGSGAHGDLNAHAVDLARFLVGEFQEVSGMSRTFVTHRQPSAEEMDEAAFREVTVDDATSFLACFENGAMGTFEASRVAGGRRCANGFEIYGSEGSIRFNFERMNELEVYDTGDDAGSQGFKTILATESCHPYMHAWWPAGHGIGFEHTFIHAVLELLEAIKTDRPCSPNFTDGLRCQQVLDAVEKSIASRQWVRVESNL
ncbi:dehydrogenase [Paenibacillus swuensis]|uniref:Dehydrogenase n=1 Tax=Paenibacillus swuensis TaxID=1178515 RepID=A0A172TH06_9BACL|nr:Gfo/Idh/MocA family oxidoreductase [Paenibacillus swuensis]ANE46164.1 dehydrogenase [Paenibacillus swuensis]